MQFDDPNSQPKMNDQTPLTDAVETSLVAFVLATPHHAPADLSHEVQNSSKLTEEQLEAIGFASARSAIAGGSPETSPITNTHSPYN